MPLIEPLLPPLPICKVPAVIVVEPLYVLVPMRTVVPAVERQGRLTAAVWITPLKVAEPAAGASVRIEVLLPLLVTRPLPVNEPSVAEKPFRSRTPLVLLIDRGEAPARALPPPNWSVPALIVVGPL